MVKRLDDVQGMKASDISDLIGQIMELPDQLEWGRGYKVETIKGVERVIICGVGGSAIAGDVATDLLSSASPVPITTCRDVSLPAFADGSTLAVVISYSGNTAESLNLYEDAKRHGCRVAVVTSGGRIEELAAVNSDILIKVPAGNQPRASTGYLLGAVSIILKSAGIGDLQEEMLRAVPGLRSYMSTISMDVPASNNQAKKVAMALQGDIVAIYAPRPVRSLALRWQNQLNENAKAVAFSGEIPEMDHNQLVGWLEGGKECSCRPAFLIPDELHPTIRKMTEVTLQMFNERGLDPILVNLPGQGLVENVLQGMALGDLVSYYLSMLKDIDPAPVSVIKEFKRRISL